MEISSNHLKAYIIKAYTYSSEDEKRDICEKVKDFLIKGQCILEPNDGETTLIKEEDILYSFKKYSKYLFNITPENVLVNTSPWHWDLTFGASGNDTSFPDPHDVVYFNIEIRDSLYIRKIIHFSYVRFSVDYSSIENNPPEGDSIKKNFLERQLKDWQNNFLYEVDNFSHLKEHIGFVDGKVKLPTSKIHYPLLPELEFYFDRRIDPKARALFVGNKPDCFILFSWREEDYTFLDARKYKCVSNPRSKIVGDREEYSIPDQYLSTGTKVVIEARYKKEYTIVGV